MYAGGGSIWPGIVAAVVLAVVFAAAIWTYVRNRPTRPTATRRHEQDTNLLKAA
jgi:membrane protein implicated in regulation of membrane protease activity